MKSRRKKPLCLCNETMKGEEEHKGYVRIIIVQTVGFFF